MYYIKLKQREEKQMTTNKQRKKYLFTQKSVRDIIDLNICIMYSYSMILDRKC